MAAGRYARCVDNVIEQVDEDTLKAVYTYELATPQRTKVTVEYTADTTGRLNLHVEYPGESGDLPPFLRLASNGLCRSSIRI